MVSAWERALARGEGPAAPVKRKYQDLTPAGRAELRRSVVRRNLAPAPLPERLTRQSESQRSLERFMPTYENTMVQQGEIGELTPEYLRGEAVRTAELARDVFTPYQEFKAAEQAASEGRVGAAAGWGLLGLAGMVPLVGDVAQGLGAAGRAAGLAGDVARGAERAANVGRAAKPNVRVISEDVVEFNGRYVIPNPNNPSKNILLPGISNNGTWQGGGKPLSIENVPDEIFHVTTNLPAIRSDGVIRSVVKENVGMGGGFVGGSVSATVNRKVAERLEADLKTLVRVLNAENQEETYDILRTASRSLGLDANDSETLINILKKQFPNFSRANRASIFENWSVYRHMKGITHSGIMAEQNAEFFKNLSLENIGIISIDKNRIPRTALVSDFDIGFPQGSDEIRIYADIPLDR